MEQLKELIAHDSNMDKSSMKVVKPVEMGENVFKAEYTSSTLNSVDNNTAPSLNMTGLMRWSGRTMCFRFANQQKTVFQA